MSKGRVRKENQAVLALGGGGGGERRGLGIRVGNTHATFK